MRGEVPGGWVDNRTEAERSEDEQWQALFQRWAQCPKCGSEYVFAGQSERGREYVMCGTCSYSERLEIPS